MCVNAHPFYITIPVSRVRQHPVTYSRNGIWSYYVLLREYDFGPHVYVSNLLYLKIFSSTFSTIRSHILMETRTSCPGSPQGSHPPQFHLLFTVMNVGWPRLMFSVSNLLMTPWLLIWSRRAKQSTVDVWVHLFNLVFPTLFFNWCDARSLQLNTNRTKGKRNIPVPVFIQGKCCKQL